MSVLFLVFLLFPFLLCCCLFKKKSATSKSDETSQEHTSRSTVVSNPEQKTSRQLTKTTESVPRVGPDVARSVRKEQSLRVEATQKPSTPAMNAKEKESLSTNTNLEEDTRDDAESLKGVKLNVPSEDFVGSKKDGKDSMYLVNMKKSAYDPIKEDNTAQSERTVREVRKNSKEKAHHKKRKSKELGEITAREKSKVKSAARKKSREKTRTAEEKDIDTAKEKGKESKVKEKTLEGRK